MASVFMSMVSARRALLAWDWPGDVRGAQERSRARRALAELSRTLTLEQRAKFLLFNRQFDSRLRELVERHRGGHGAPDGPGRDAERRPPIREERIESLERRIAEMQRDLEKLRADSD